ncbi:hypothetical protein G1C96_1692 [Bifidobacterium sp. DSM 109958]|uniref:Uncharacterized protein n=1 Tax=Bifidobacterium moraviense TaxID=2675323 RepID=A0A7Y0F323_9BIFI|nr:hypothetical protein [Bifidobacterium sp. DSM 109958]
MHFTRALIYGQVRLAETQTRSAGAPKPAVAQ